MESIPNLSRQNVVSKLTSQRRVVGAINCTQLLSKRNRLQPAAAVFALFVFLPFVHFGFVWTSYMMGNEIKGCG